jgi:hypothetical protein
VASQLNVHHYEVEKSFNGRNFSKAGTVQAGNAAAYNWLDENAVTGANFYRVKAIDNNGLFKYTGVVKVMMNNMGGGITVSPNPVQGRTVNILFANQQPGKYTVSILNEGGQVVYTTVIKHSNGDTRHTVSLSPGIGRGVFQLLVTSASGFVSPVKLVLE